MGSSRRDRHAFTFTEEEKTRLSPPVQGGPGQMKESRNREASCPKAERGVRACAAFWELGWFNMASKQGES